VTGKEAFHAFLLGWIALAPVIALVLMRIAAPYGRHGGGRVGPRVPARPGWFLMELPALLVFPAWAAWAGRFDSPLLYLLLALWVLHYGNRALLYPLRLRGGSPMPVVIVASGVFFNLVNGSVLGLGLTVFDPLPAGQGLLDPWTAGGVLLFWAGFALNLHSDAVLRALRREGPGYRVPTRGAFQWVSCPNYLGEIVEWTGFAIATWSLPGLAFAVWTAANLLPRALTHHRWYRTTFPDYPAGRKALVPFVL